MRRENDFYPTPEFATRELLKRVKIGGNVLECCCGDGAISRVLPEGELPSTIFRNDIDVTLPADFHEDVSFEEAWHQIGKKTGFDWIVTNPPFNRANDIVPLAFEFAEVGIAMLLRLSFLEPTEDRGAWLNKYPPTKLIVLPRISFTGDGKTDSVTCAWMVWKKNDMGQQIFIAENPRFMKREIAQDEMFATT